MTQDVKLIELTVQRLSLSVRLRLRLSGVAQAVISSSVALVQHGTVIYRSFLPVLSF